MSKIPELLLALSLIAVFSVLAYMLRMVSWSGAAGGFALGSIIYVSLGWRGFAVLALFVVGGSALTRLGYRNKRRRGIAQERGGRRGAGNAIANTGVAVLCALSAALTPYSGAFAAAFVASLAAAFADTAESEIGQLSRRAPKLIVGMKRVPPGTDGAITPEGTLAGLVAAALTAGLGLSLGVLEGVELTVAVAAAGFAGTVVDSLIGALIPRAGNGAANVACTLSAALLAFVFAAGSAGF